MSRQPKRNPTTPAAPRAALADTPSPQAAGAIERLNSLVLDAEEETGEIQDNGLTLRQQAFVVALTGPAFMNMVKAAEMAGYNAANRTNLSLCANRNVNAPHVARAIRLTLAKKFREDPDWLDNEAYALATTTMNDFLTVDEQGGVKVDFAKAIRTGAIAAVKDLKFDGETGICTDLKLHDRISAMEFYAKLSGRMKGDAPAGGPNQINLNITLVRDEPRKQVGDIHVEPIETLERLRSNGSATPDG